MAEFILPNLGDGVAQGDVLKVLVKIGDTIAVDQPVVELETDKATIEVPSNVAGRVTEIRVKAGDKVGVSYTEKDGKMIASSITAVKAKAPAKMEEKKAETKGGMK